jgi:acyl-CoA synthetase (AMP-forming)/AMP-acid ligase II
MTLEATPPVQIAPLLPRISDYVQWHAQNSPDAVALVLNDLRVDYKTLCEEVDLLAKALLNAGVKKNDRVATLCPPSPDYFRCFLATASIGAIWVGLNPLYKINELSHVTGDSEPVVLLSRSNMEGEDISSKLAELKQQSPSIRSLVILDDNETELPETGQSYQDFISAGASISDKELLKARENCGERDPCLIVYTSGSTGRPKGALLHHQGVVELSLEQNRAWPVSPLRVLNYFPVNHIGCVVDISAPVLVAGGTIVFMEKFLPHESLEIIESQKITLWGSVPSVFFLQFAEQDITKFDFSAVQLIVWEGAAISLEMIQVLLQYGVPLATNYGMSESCGAITIVEPTTDLFVLEKTVGKALKGVEIRLLDDASEPVKDGEPGEIVIRSKYNMLGYWNNPEATGEALSADGWFSTGDLAHKNPDGTYTIRGRVTEMYKSGGYNVYPREVENVIETFPGVVMAAVVFIEDPIWQEVGVAYVLPSEEITVDELMAHCRSMLANYKIPKNIILTRDIPLLPVGKVDNVKLKKMATAQFIGKT